MNAEYRSESQLKESLHVKADEAIPEEIAHKFCFRQGGFAPFGREAETAGEEEGAGKVQGVYPNYSADIFYEQSWAVITIFEALVVGLWFRKIEN